MHATEVGSRKDITKKTLARMEEEVSKGPVEGINSDNKVGVGVVAFKIGVSGRGMVCPA